MELLLLGETVDAHEGQRIGLVAKVFPAADLSIRPRRLPTKSPARRAA